MPKLNRKQRFAVLRNIFDELGETAVMRQAARLQVPADDARALLAEWKGGKPAIIDDAPEADEAPAPRKVRPVKIERVQRPVTAASVGEYVRKAFDERRGVAAGAVTGRTIRPVTKPGKPEVRIPPEVESGVMVDGYKDAELKKGTHVQRVKGDAIGVIIGIGPQQCEVKWFETGTVQAEITKQLRRAK